MSDIRVTELDRERCRTMRDTLIQLPKRALQLYPGKSCAFILRQDLPPMNPKTANKGIHFFSSMLTWAERETLIDKHPARALTVSLRQRPSDERNAYAKDELGILFRGWSRLKGDPPRYWGPLIGLLSEMRLGQGRPPRSLIHVPTRRSRNPEKPDRQIGSTEEWSRYADCRIRTGFAFDPKFATLPVTESGHPGNFA